jgi:hypothetical protein
MMVFNIGRSAISKDLGNYCYRMRWGAMGLLEIFFSRVAKFTAGMNKSITTLFGSLIKVDVMVVDFH